MQNGFTFVVQPGGASFNTTFCPLSGISKGEGFYNAHLHAANQAANTKGPAWVLRADTEDMRYGFGPAAAWTTTTVLYQINQMGLQAFWDDSTLSWRPIESAQADASTATELEVV